MTASLSVSRNVSVSVNLSPPAAQSQSLSNLLFLGTSGVIDPVERYRSYNTLSAVASDFGTSAEEYKAASRWFSQSPQPTTLMVGRFVNAASQGGLRCATLSAAQQSMTVWNAITTGALKIAKDGAAAVAVTGINFSGCANMNAVAAAIQAGTGMPVGVTVTWNSVYNRFELASNTTGATSAIGFLQAPGSGTDITGNMLGRATDSGAYVYAGQAAETAASCLATFDDMVGQLFYGVALGGLTPGANGGADTAAILAAAAYVEASAYKHLLGVTTQEAGAISSVSTTDIAYQLAQLLYNRTLQQYSSTAQHAAVELLARILTVNYEGSNTAITLKYKQEPGVVAETLTSTQADALKAKNCNVYDAYNNGTNIVEQGVVASGQFVDTITGSDWLATTIQRDVYNLFYTSTTKIPQTDDGANLVQATVEARCIQGVANGFMAPGVWNASGFGLLKQGDYLSKGYYVYITPMAKQAAADRAARKCPPIQVAAKLAGAIHSADVTINVNP